MMKNLGITSLAISRTRDLGITRVSRCFSSAQGIMLLGLGMRRICTESFSTGLPHSNHFSSPNRFAWWPYDNRI